MNRNVIIFFTVFFALYGLCNYYIGVRGFQAISRISLSLARLWIVAAIFLTLAYPLGRFVVDSLPHAWARSIIYLGSYWLAAMYYLLIILLVSDLARFVIRKTGLLPPQFRGQYNLVILGVFILVTILLIYGTWNSRNPVIRNYEVTLNKKSSSLDSMRIVAVSDIHLGWIVGISRLEHMTALINSLDPDLVLLPGDIVDEGVDLEAELAMPAVLQTLNPRLGSFASMGNHEYISGNAEATIGFLNRAGITVLRDQAMEIPNDVYLVGRDDASRHRFNGAARKELSEIISAEEAARLPVILLDHEPFNLEISEQAGIDLQFSGHTHLGQLYPNNYITRAIYENDWGYLKKNTLQVIVSCGYGTWGPPIRIGNRPEIVNVLVHFTPNI